MTEKRFITMWKPETIYSKFWIARDNGEKMNANDVVDLLNKQEERIKELKTRNQRQYNQLKEITDLMFKRDWKTLENIVEDWEQAEEQLEREWGSYGDVE